MDKKLAKTIRPKKQVLSGQLWRLGDHRLLCGSATEEEDVKKAVGGGNMIRQILTDPPYGVAYIENKDWMGLRGPSKEKEFKKIAGDQLQSDRAYADFTQGWLQKAVPFLSSYNTVYIFNSDLMMCALRQGMKDAGIYYSQMIIWIKNTIVMGRKDYLPQHEIIAYGWHGRHKMERSKGKSVIFYPKPHRSALHPTMKPVGLVRQLMLDATKIGEWVYDPFGGSGSTLIAAEHTKRRCIMLEQDAGYCATIIQRWELLTGKEAQKV